MWPIKVLTKVLPAIIRIRSQSKEVARKADREYIILAHECVGAPADLKSHLCIDHFHQVGRKLDSASGLLLEKGVLSPDALLESSGEFGLNAKDRRKPQLTNDPHNGVALVQDPLNLREGHSPILPN